MIPSYLLTFNMRGANSSTIHTVPAPGGALNSTLRRLPPYVDATINAINFNLLTMSKHSNAPLAQLFASSATFFHRKNFPTPDFLDVWKSHLDVKSCKKIAPRSPAWTSVKSGGYGKDRTLDDHLCGDPNSRRCQNKLGCAEPGHVASCSSCWRRSSSRIS